MTYIEALNQLISAGYTVGRTNGDDINLADALAACDEDGRDPDDEDYIVDNDAVWHLRHGYRASAPLVIGVA